MCHIGGLNLSKEELKREIVELVDQIDNEKILKLIAGFVKSGYKRNRQGNKPLPFLFDKLFNQ